MTNLAPQEAVLREMPAGQLEYWCRESIRDLVRLYGFENARELIAIYINEEADRRYEH